MCTKDHARFRRGTQEFVLFVAAEMIRGPGAFAGTGFASPGERNEQPKPEVAPMLGWALAFFLVAIVAAVFGFTGIAVGLAAIAKVLFFLFVALFILSLVRGLVRRSSM
jgi:uncharacterized membrane protein YtjA (UPF0391 family)